jgi:hypothetical protein
MLEANGGDFPSDPEALPNDWLGAGLLRHSSPRVPTIAGRYVA